MRIEKEVKVLNVNGLHARPAALFVKVASRYQAEIELVFDDISVSGKSIMGLLTLGCEQGTPLTIVADGVDAEEAAVALVDIFDRKFDEE